MQFQKILTSRNILLIVIFAFSTPCFSQTEKDIVKKTSEYVSNAKYETAYKYLDSLDPLNRNADIVLLKEDIALNFYVETYNHQRFGLKDLGKTQKVNDIRGRTNGLVMHTFKINKVLDSLIKVYPNNFKLYKGLGDYYYEVHQKYGNDWLINERELLGLIEYNYRGALNDKMGDFETNYRLGLTFETDGNYQAGIPYFLKAVQLNDSSADAHYNLAYAFLNVNDTLNALRHSLSATKLYKDSSSKGDAARMAGVVLGEMGKQKKAIEFMELSNTIAPNNYNTLKILIDMYLKVDNRKKEREVTDAFYQLGVDKPTIYNDLIDIYAGNAKQKQLITFFQGQLKQASGDMVQLGSLYLSIGKLYMGNDKNLALENLTKASEVFATVYKPENPVFKLIYDMMKSLK